MATFERLTALDATFLALDEAGRTVHVALLALFPRAPLASADGRLDEARIGEHMRGVAARLPRLRRRLAHTPAVSHPVLVADPHFDAARQLHFVALSNGDERELEELASRIYSQPLDRGRPLWELWCIDGLAGERVALLVKVHQSLLDDDGGLETLRLLFGPALGASLQNGEAVPSTVELAAAELRRYVGTMSAAALNVLSRLHHAPGPKSALEDMSRVLAQLTSGVRYLFSSALVSPMRVPRSQNPVVTAERVRWVSLSARELTAIARATHSSADEVLLTLLVLALRRAIERRGRVPDASTLRLLVRSYESERAKESFARRAAFTIVSLVLGHESASACLERTARALRTGEAASQNHALATAETIADLTYVNFATLAARVGTRLAPFDVVFTRAVMPSGASFLGAPLLDAYPFAPLYLNNALSVVALDYGEHVYLGLTADGSRVPELEHIPGDISAAFAELGAKPQNVN